jgi:hypothetical protein
VRNKLISDVKTNLKNTHELKKRKRKNKPQKEITDSFFSFPRKEKTSGLQTSVVVRLHSKE